jgi:hypothetical protein
MAKSLRKYFWIAFAVTFAALCGVSVGTVTPIASAYTCGKASGVAAILSPSMNSNNMFGGNDGVRAQLTVDTRTVNCAHVNSIEVMNPYDGSEVEIGWIKTKMGGCNGIPSDTTYVFWTRTTPAGYPTCNWDRTPIPGGAHPTLSVYLDTNATTDS